jgi:hypothetical protein
MTKRLAFSLPLRLPLLNEQLRSHWQARRKSKRNLSWHVKIAILRLGAMPVVPMLQARIIVVRYSYKQPDGDNLAACVKPLLDVLQPLSRRHPCGLGVIVDDSPDCVTVTVEHRKSKEVRTDVEIFC